MKTFKQDKIFWKKFSSNNRNKYSLYIFVIIFFLSLFAELLSNDKPIIMKMDNKIYYPIVISYTEQNFGGYFDTEADY